MQFTSCNDDLPPVHSAEFWTAKQRAGHAIHEVSYRACYKPQLPAYFLKKFCQKQSVVYDPFMGRGEAIPFFGTLVRLPPRLGGNLLFLYQMELGKQLKHGRILVL